MFPPLEIDNQQKSQRHKVSVWHVGGHEKKLKDKVRRSNNLTVEIQGAVVVTSK